MLLAALVDCGLDLNALKASLKTLKTIENEWDITVSSVLRSEGRIGAKHVNVASIFNHEPAAVPGSSSSLAIVPAHDHSHSQLSLNLSHSDNHDHDHNHSHNHNHSHGHSHDHNSCSAHDHSHPVDHSIIPPAPPMDHSHGHSHDHHSHDGHEHHDRGLQQISHIVRTSTLPDRVKSIAIAAFTELAVAESRVHGTTLEEVHFHEVGAIDSIVDTVGVIIAFHLLGVEEVYCSALPMSTGTVWTAHGLLPVPAPATLQLFKGMVLVPGPKGVSGELVTPTGASLIRALCGMPSLLDSPVSRGDGSASGSGSCSTSGNGSGSGSGNGIRQGVLPPPGFRLLTAGVGAGTKDFPKHPNILRVLIGEIPSYANTPLLPMINFVPHISHTEKVALPVLSASVGPGTVTAAMTAIATVTATGTTTAATTAAMTTTTTSSASVAQGCVDDPLDHPLWTEEPVLLLEANIDDMTAELTAHLLYQLMGAGARDAWSSPIGMKKNRPGVTVSALCTPDQRDALLLVIFRQSTTIGVRFQPMGRAALRRRMVVVSTPYGEVRAKVSFLGDQVVTIKPEFDDCKAIAERENVSLKRVQDAANAAAQVHYDTSYGL